MALEKIQKANDIKELTEEELEALVKALTKLNTWFRSF
mgnify:CR=1 FL=1